MMLLRRPRPKRRKIQPLDREEVCSFLNNEITGAKSKKICFKGMKKFSYGKGFQRDEELQLWERLWRKWPKERDKVQDSFMIMPWRGKKQIGSLHLRRVGLG